MPTPIQTKYLTGDFLRENRISSVFLELVDECIWCWYLESKEILDVLSIEEMDISTLVSYFKLYNIIFRSYDDNDINRYTLINWFRIMHNRGITQTIESMISINGELKPTNNLVDITLYTPPEVPYDIVSNPQNGYLYAVTSDFDLDIQSNSIVNQVMPAGYRIIIIKQLPPNILKSSTRIDFSSNKNKSINIDLEDKINLSLLINKNYSLYKSPQHGNNYNYTQLFKNGYSICSYSELSRKYKYFSNSQYKLEKTGIEIAGTFVDNDVIYYSEYSVGGNFEINELYRKNVDVFENAFIDGGTEEINVLWRINVDSFEGSVVSGNSFIYYPVIDVLNEEVEFISTDVDVHTESEPLYIIDDILIGGQLAQD